MTSRFVGLVLGYALIAGCQNEVSVEVHQTGKDVVFVARRHGDAACIDDVRVYTANDQLSPIWTLGAPGNVPCRSEFRYGSDVPGFMTDGTAPRLRTGTRYVVSMTGPGQIGQGEFTKAN